MCYILVILLVYLLIGIEFTNKKTNTIYKKDTLKLFFNIVKNKTNK